MDIQEIKNVAKVSSVTGLAGASAVAIITLIGSALEKYDVVKVSNYTWQPNAAVATVGAVGAALGAHYGEKLKH